MMENPTVHLTALRNSCAKIACCSSQLVFTFLMLAAASKMRTAVRLVYSPFFCKLRASSNPTNKNLTQLGLRLKIQTALSLQPFRVIHTFIRTFFLTLTDLVTSHHTYWPFLLCRPAYDDVSQHLWSLSNYSNQQLHVKRLKVIHT